jgi:hypothetical protein
MIIKKLPSFVPIIGTMFPPKGTESNTYRAWWFYYQVACTIAGMIGTFAYLALVSFEKLYE